MVALVTFQRDVKQQTPRKPEVHHTPDIQK